MKILVVVDMQNDFITGSLGTPEARAIVPNVKKKIEEYVKNGDWIVYTRDTHGLGYLATREGQKLPVEHCIKGTEGWEIPDELYPPTKFENREFINKPTFGSLELVNYIETKFMYENEEEDPVLEIELCGLCTDICVVSNALLLKAYLYNLADISVDANCCAGVTPETHEAALKTMEQCQIKINR